MQEFERREGALVLCGSCSRLGTALKLLTQAAGSSSSSVIPSTASHTGEREEACGLGTVEVTTSPSQVRMQASQ